MCSVDTILKMRVWNTRPPTRRTRRLHLIILKAIAVYVCNEGLKGCRCLSRITESRLGSRPTTPPLSSGHILARDPMLTSIKRHRCSISFIRDNKTTHTRQKSNIKMLEITCKGSPYEVSEPHIYHLSHHRLIVLTKTDRIPTRFSSDSPDSRQHKLL